MLGLTFTLLAYQGALLINKRCNANPLANPVLLAVAALVITLWATETPYRTYFEGAQFVHFLLGPATVALAIPLYAQLGRLKRMAVPLLVALLAGSKMCIRDSLSTQAPKLADTNFVNARDRIGTGPWQNAKGDVIARSVDERCV